MLAAAAVCPQPALLVPAIGRGGGPELDHLRSQCATAVDVLRTSDLTVLFVVGADVGLRARSLAPWGVDVPVDVPEPMPLSVLVGGWLTAGALRSFVVVDPALEPDDCAELGHELSDAAGRVGLLVMGDGSARHDVKAPGYFDERAAAYDARIAEIFAAGDLSGLASLDPVLSDELMVTGRAPWQVLAAAAGGPARAVLRAEFGAPYGVGYHVAAWQWQD